MDEIGSELCLMASFGISSFECLCFTTKDLVKFSNKNLIMLVSLPNCKL